MKTSFFILWMAVAMGLMACGGNNANNAVQRDSTTTTKPAEHQAPQASPKDDRMIVVGQKVGAITATTTRAQLEEIFGKENVKDVTLYGPEGMEFPGTKVYPDQADELEIGWKDDATMSGVSLVRISGVGSTWKSDQGIGIGTTLAQLETINGKPISFYGFGWDFGGLVSNLNGGKITEGFGMTLNSDSAPADFAGDMELVSDKVKGLDKNTVTVVAISLGF